MTDKVNGGVCRSGIGLDQVIGVPCPNCGHTDLVHPGGHNPAIGECLLCRLEAAIARFEGEKGETSP